MAGHNVWNHQTYQLLILIFCPWQHNFRKFQQNVGTVYFGGNYVYKLQKELLNFHYEHSLHLLDKATYAFDIDTSNILSALYWMSETNKIYAFLRK